VPQLGGREWEYIRECLETNWISSVGPFVNRFEDEVAQRVGATYGIATVTGTAAIHVGLLLAGLGLDDEVVMPAISFIAGANAVRYVGAWPTFVDAEPEYLQLDIEKLASFLSEGCRHTAAGLMNRATGRRVAAVLPVHVLGHPVDLEPLLELAEIYAIPIVEDAAESLGARYRMSDGRWIGVGGAGLIGCFSFNGNKVITSGGGGMIVTNHLSLAERARYLTTTAKDDPIAYIHNEVGFNFRLGNVQAALGCAQLEQLDDHVAAKRRIAEVYREGLDGIPAVRLVGQAPWAESTHWLSTAVVDGDKAPLDRDALVRDLGARGVQTRPIWEPLHRSKAHAGSFAWRCEAADRLGAEGLCLPSSVGLTNTEQGRVVDALRAVLSG
jgi:perosamine synthetase